MGAERVDAACAIALDHEAVNVKLIGRMLERGTDHARLPATPPGGVVPSRFARDPDHFAVRSRPPTVVEAAMAAALAEDAQ
ncbi:MAG TPA: hypothetical protein VGJ43_17345 [Acidimicrobiales bacterium]